MICILCTLTLFTPSRVKLLQFQSLVANTLAYMEQNLTFCCNHEELHIMYKVVGLSQVVGIRFVALPNDNEEVNQIDWEVIVGEGPTCRCHTPLN